MRIASLATAVVLSVALAGCAPITIIVGPTGVPTPTPTETTPPEPGGPTALVLGVHGLTVDDGDDATVDPGSSREDPGAGLALLTDLFGEPELQTTDFGTSYDWGGAVSATDSGWFNVRFSQPDLDGIELRTAQGVQVGATRADVTAFDTFDDGFDSDGDGNSDLLGLEPEPEPDTESLSHPGDVGTSYIAVFFDGDTVTGLAAPGGDWRDL